MKLCNRDILKIHGVHPVWSSLPAVTREVTCILEKKALGVVFIDSQLSFHQVLQLCVL
jgi:hypothetical protein